MNQVKVQDYYKHNKVRHRKTEKSSLNKMVGLGSDELLVSDIASTPMELEISSDECGDDMQQLIPSSMNTDCINSDSKTDDSSKRSKTENTTDDENVWSISIQMFIPFLLAGFGMVAASLLLDVVQVFKDFKLL